MYQVDIKLASTVIIGYDLNLPTRHCKQKSYLKSKFWPEALHELMLVFKTKLILGTANKQKNLFVLIILAQFSEI